MIETFGDKIKIAREKAGFTQEALAREAGITLNSMYRIEKNKMIPTFPIVAKISDALKISLDLLK
jgi:transcriptional regulator with XRE-family HTH domain